MSLAALLRETGLADDTGMNVPESKHTLQAQQRALVERRQRAQMFPIGTTELPLPEGMERVETPRGVFHFDPEQVTAEEIARASRERRENEILGLGPASKDEVLIQHAHGAPVAAMVEEDADGNEVKGAVVTTDTATAAKEEMERRKAPGNVVTLRVLDDVLAARPDGSLAELLRATGADRMPPQHRRTASETAAQSGKLLLRGASAEGVYAGMEGVARGVAGAVPTLAGEIPGTELAGIDTNLERLKTRRRELLGEPSRYSTFASADAPPVNPADDRVIEEIDREIATLEARKAGVTAKLKQAANWYPDAVRDTRETIRRELPVDDDLAESLPGQILQGLGQAAGTLPLYAVPGLGPGVTLGQVYQSGYDDAKSHGADDETAGRAAVANLPAAVLDYAADKLVIGKILKPLRGKITVGQLLKDVLKTGAASGASEGAQQAWQNHVARSLEQYDPDRPLDDQVIWSMLVGAVVGGVATGAGQLATGRRSRAEPEPLDERRSEPEARESTPEPGKTGVSAETATAASGRPLWRQIDSKTLAGLVGNGDLPESKWFAADMRELALGRGENRSGPVIELDSSGLAHELAPRKPGMGFLTAAHGAQGEVIIPVGGAGGNEPASVRSSLRAIELTPEQFNDTTATDSPGSIARRLLSEGWQMSSVDGGLVRIERTFPVTGRDAIPGGEDGPVVVEPGLVKKPALGDPAESIATAIRRRPNEDFKPVLPEKLKADDVDVVSHLARYADATRGADEDFAGFAERMQNDLGDRVQAYLPTVWEAVSEGRPVKDVVGLDNPVKIEPAWQRATKWGRLFWEGSADVLRRAGVRSLADAIDTHVDHAERNLAKAWGFIRPAVEKYQGVTGLVNRGRGKQVFQEFADFYRARENGRLEDAARILNEAHPETRRLVDGVQRMFEFTGRENRRLGVRVQAHGGGWQPIGYLGREAFPRMLREDVLAVLRDPSSNPKLWQEMQRQLVENGNVARREEAGQFLAEQTEGETGSDFFGAMEKARAARLPEQWYEYRFWKVIPRYVAQWSERSAQIEAFGQKTGPESRDAFDHAREMTGNEEARRYISAAQDHAYRVNRLHPGARRALGNVTGATTALFLGNPYSTLRNLIGGTAQTVNQFGVLRSISELRRAWRALPDAEAAGALKADVADMLFADDGAPVARQGANLALKAAGFSAVENFVRSHSYITAKGYLRDALRLMREAPGSRRNLQDVAFLRRLGFDPDRLAAENLDGPETDRFLRGAVRESQGSYRYGQIPLFVDSPLGRFLFQFARWGTQATRFHAEHIVQPAIEGELVPVKGKDGRTEMRRVRTLLPLLRSPLVAAAAGATTYALREALFGLDRPDATWDEVFRTLDDDQQRGIELALGRVFNDVVMGGTMGALTDYGAMFKDAAERTRFKNPLEPPAASILKEAGLLAYKLAQQGRLSAQDYRQFAERILTGYRYGKAMAYRFADAVGADWAAARTYQAEQDRRFARTVGRRYANEVGFDQAGGMDGLPRVNENSPDYDDLESALLAGDAGAVARIRDRFLAAATDADQRRERLNLLRTSALGRQPIKPGGRGSAEIRVSFASWARHRLSGEERRRLAEIQRKYLETGLRAGLFTGRDADRYSFR